MGSSRLTWERVTVGGTGGAVYGVVGTGPPLLFLHGWGLGYRSYRRSLESLAAAGSRVYAPALPGFGGTRPLPPEDFSIAGYARWVGSFLEAVGLDQPVALVGHSFGGGVAIRLAYDEAARVRHLVLVNSIGGSAWVQHGSVLRSLAERPLWDWGLHMSLDLFPIRQFTRVVPVIVEDALPNLVRDPLSVWRVAHLARTANLTAELEELRRRELPIVVLWGKADRVLPQASLESLCAAAGVGPEQCLRVEGRHTWILTDPEALGEVMTNVGSLGRALRATEE
jgi:pimeloyl-ACP methyl ester carboxylesterase